VGRTASRLSEEGEAARLITAPTKRFFRGFRHLPPQGYSERSKARRSLPTLKPEEPERLRQLRDPNSGVCADYAHALILADETIRPRMRRVGRCQAYVAIPPRWGRERSPWT